MKHHKHKGRGGPKGPKQHRKPASKLKCDLFGHHAVRAAWDNEKRHVHALYATDQALKDFDLKAPAKRPAPTIVAREDLDRALPPGSVHQGLALSCQPLEEVDIQDIIISDQNKPKSMIIMLDQVTDPHNVGAILRSACAFGATGLVMQRKHAPDLTGVLAKTACGAVEHVPVAYETNLSRTLEKLKENGYFAIGLDERGQSALSDLPTYEKAVLVLGAEGPGLRRLVKEGCDILVHLPMHGPMPSVNVSNAAAVSLYQLSLEPLPYKNG